MSTCSLLLLGSPQVVTDDQPTQIALRKAVALLAFLAVEQRQFSREYLATLLWPELDEKAALANLRRTLSLLRGTLDNGGLTVEGDHLKLDSTLVSVDVNEFLAFSSDGSWDAETEILESASRLYRGSFLEGFTLGDCLEFDRWQDTVRERLFLSFDALLSTLCSRFLSDGAPDLALPYAQRWLAVDPVNEAAHRALMEIHAKSGRRTAAHKQYEACTEILAVEGLEPDEVTHELHDAIMENTLELDGAGVGARERQRDGATRQVTIDSATGSTAHPQEPKEPRFLPRIRRPVILGAGAVLVIAVAVVLGFTLGPRLLQSNVSLSAVEVRYNANRFEMVRGTLTNHGAPRSQVGYALVFLSDQSVVAPREYVVYSGETDIGRNREVTVEVDRQTDVQRYVEENNVRIPPGSYSAALLLTEEWERGRSESGGTTAGDDLFFYSGSAADDAFEVTITFDGPVPLNDANPLKIYIGDITQHGDPTEIRGTEGWGEFKVASEGRYFLPEYDISVPDDDGSGYAMLIVHDVGNDLANPFAADPGDIAGMYGDGEGDLVFGRFDLSGATPIYPGRRYWIHFSTP